jgi:hypothetical protein
LTKGDIPAWAERIHPAISFATHAPSQAMASQQGLMLRACIFFKWIKQHLKLKRFDAFSENAVRLQIYSALISYLLLHLFHRRSGFPGSLFELTVRIAHVLHERPDAQAFRERRRQEREKLKAAQGSLQL